MVLSVGRRETIAGFVEDEPRQDVDVCHVGSGSPSDGLVEQPGLNAIPKLLIDDCRVLSLVGGTLMFYSAEIDRIRNQPVKVAAREWPQAFEGAFHMRSVLGLDADAIGFDF